MPSNKSVDIELTTVGIIPSIIRFLFALNEPDALGAGNVKFSGQVTPKNKLVTYRIEMRRVMLRKLIMGVADGSMLVDGKEIYTAEDLRVGLFKSTVDF